MLFNSPLPFFEARGIEMFSFLAVWAPQVQVFQILPLHLRRSPRETQNRIAAGAGRLTPFESAQPILLYIVEVRWHFPSPFLF